MITASADYPASTFHRDATRSWRPLCPSIPGEPRREGQSWLSSWLRHGVPLLVPALSLAIASHECGEKLMTTVARWVEVHGLAVAGGEAGIARDVGDRVGRVWLARSRFADVVRLAELTLSLGPDAGAFYDLGWARRATGSSTAALVAYDDALRLYRAGGDGGNEAATLSNIGGVYAGLGDRRRALEYHGQALPITREVGDRAGDL